MTRVAVFGATGYVGTRLVAELLRRGCEVVAVTRRPATARILLDLDAPGLSFAGLDEVVAETRPWDAVLNLAYVKQGKITDIYAQNKRLLGTVDAVLRTHPKVVVHISTVAVFGYSFEQAPTPRRVRWRPADPYIETKIVAENHLATSARREGVHIAIVRLGNVIGPGAPMWTASLAQAVLEHRPLVYPGSDGFSNATYVDNAVAYMLHLIDTDGAVTPDRPYHHLAEFSGHRWSEILEAIRRGVGGVELVPAPSPPPSGARPSWPAQLMTRAYGGTLGAYMRAAFGVPAVAALSRRVVEPVRDELTEGVPGTKPGEDPFVLRILGAGTRFQSVTLPPDWAPPVSFDEACLAIERWVSESGYRLAAA